MLGLTLGVELSVGLVALVLHMMSVALAKALRTYSRSRFEELCARRGRPGRADQVAHRDEATERAAEALAVLTGLLLAALLGAVAAEEVPHLTAGAVVAIALGLGALGHVAAGVIGRVHAEEIIDRFWPLARLLRQVMFPFTAASRLVEAAAYRVARRSAAVPRPASVEVEIHSMAPPDQDLEADLPDSIRSMLERVIELSSRDVQDLMTPRSEMVALPISVSAEAAARLFRETNRTRIPMFGASRDDIVGVLHLKDLFSALTDPTAPRPVWPRKLARAVYCVPETKNAAELLDEFRTRRTHLAIVLDEFGAVTGLITLEDLLERVVGPIDDEHDVPTPSDPVVSLGAGQFELDASLALELVNERLGLHLPTNGDFQTVGGLAFNTLGRLPQPGDTFRYEGADFTVVEVGEHVIRRLRIDLHTAAHDAPNGRQSSDGA